jgi:putative transposase
MRYHFFDPEAAMTVSAARLPHWEQCGTCCFITFRTADSLPVGVCKALAEDQAAWLRSHGIVTGTADLQAAARRLSAADRAALRKQTSKAWQQALDGCHGDCVLRSPTLRQHVVNTLRHGDGVQYDLEAFVVMPNHVHVLAGFADAGAVRRQCRNWKHYTATAINRSLQRRGQFWQKESYDHLVRDPESLERFRDYIAGNPRRARLRIDEYTLFLRPTSIMKEP